MRLAGFLITALALLAANVAGASAAAWEPAGPSVASWAFPASDGVHIVAYAGDEVTLHILDTMDSTAYDATIPSNCAAHDKPVVAAIGGGQVLLRCPAKQLIGSYAMRPLLFDLATRTWHEVVGIDAWIPPGDPSSDLTLMFDVGRIGARWLELFSGRGPKITRSWIDWHTGELRVSHDEASEAVDLDSPALYVPLCRPLSWSGADSGTYAPPFAIGRSLVEPLMLRRCGSARAVRLFGNPGTLAAVPQIGGGIVSWERAYVLRPYAYLLECGVRLDWASQRGILVNAGRDLYLKQVPYGGDVPTRLLRLRLPADCPSSPAADPLRVRAANGRVVLVPPGEAAWRTSADWGGARAQIVVGTFATPRLALRRGAARITLPASATSLRWRTEAGRWHAGTMQDTDGRVWSVVPRLSRVYGELSVKVRFDDGATVQSMVHVRTARS